MSEPKYTLRDYGLLCERLFIDWSDHHKRSMIGEKSVSTNNLRLPPLKRNYRLQNNHCVYIGKRPSQRSGASSVKGYGPDETPEESRDQILDGLNKNPKTDYGYSSTHNAQPDSQLNTINFDLQGTQDISTFKNNVNFGTGHSHGDSEAQTPLKMTLDSNELKKGFATSGSAGNLNQNYTWDYSGGRGQVIPPNLATTNDAVLIQNSDIDLLQENPNNSSRNLLRFNPFSMKKKSYQIRKTPIGRQKNRHFEEFIKPRNSQDNFKTLENSTDKNGENTEGTNSFTEEAGETGENFFKPGNEPNQDFKKKSTPEITATRTDPDQLEEESH
jgi:hypothetical protein